MKTRSKKLKKVLSDTMPKSQISSPLTVIVGSNSWLEYELQKSLLLREHNIIYVESEYTYNEYCSPQSANDLDNGNSNLKSIHIEANDPQFNETVKDALSDFLSRNTIERLGYSKFH